VTDVTASSRADGQSDSASSYWEDMAWLGD